MAHSVRTIAEGADLWAFIESGTTFKPIAAQTNASISDDSDEMESTAKNNGSYANYQYGINRWSATVDVMETNDTDAAEVDLAELRIMKRAKFKPTIFFAHVDVLGEIDTTRPAFRGLVLIKTPINAPNGELQKTTINMQGCLELENLKWDSVAIPPAWVKIAATYPIV